MTLGGLQRWTGEGETIAQLASHIFFFAFSPTAEPGPRLCTLLMHSLMIIKLILIVVQNFKIN